MGPTRRAGDSKAPSFPSSPPILLLPGKIEIKIVRPGAEGKEEDTRWLTDEDTRNLKEIFFNILVRHPTHILSRSTHHCAAQIRVWLCQPYLFVHPILLSQVTLSLSCCSGESIGRVHWEATSLVPASRRGLRTSLDPTEQESPWLNPSFLPGAGSRRGQ